MFDTVKLKFRCDPPQNHFFERTKTKGGGVILTNNRWRNIECQRGLYIPTYFIARDFINPTITYLYFEASLPKLLWGNNLREIKESDFDQVINAIAAFFNKIGIAISAEEIANTIPTVIAIGKNIEISDLCGTAKAIKILEPFDYKGRSSHDIIKFNNNVHGGKELIFSTSNSESFKVYEKMKEMANSHRTSEERAIAQQWIDGGSKEEVLRFELTLRTNRKIQSKLKPFLGGKEPSLKNIFKRQIWNQVLNKEIERVFKPPLKDLILLSSESQKRIDDFLDVHCQTIQTRAVTRAAIMDIDELGYAGMRQKYMTRFKSRGSWYNLQKRLAKFDCSALTQTTNKTVYDEVLRRLLSSDD